MNEEEISDDQPQTLLFHLTELRSMLLRIMVVVLGLFAVLMPFGRRLFSWAAQPLVDKLPLDTSMQAIDIVSGFLIPFKLSFYTALFVAMPYILYQLWGFVAPGLYKREKKTAIPLLLSSIALFYLGVLFVYYIVFPMVFAFLVRYMPEVVQFSPDIARYLDFMVALCLVFGLAFEIPVATVLLVQMGVTTTQSLAKKRPYILIGAFTVGMFLTPPDIISQIFLAVPMYLLYELGIFLSRKIESKKTEQTEASAP